MSAHDEHNKLVLGMLLDHTRARSASMEELINGPQTPRQNAGARARSAMERLEAAPGDAVAGAALDAALTELRALSKQEREDAENAAPGATDMDDLIRAAAGRTRTL